MATHTMHFAPSSRANRFDSQLRAEQLAPSRKVTWRERDLINLVKEISMEPIVLNVTQTVFDLDRKDDVTVFKSVTFTPVDSTKEALERVGNDSAKFLEIVNAGLADYTREQAKTDSSQPWMEKDGEEEKEFSGTLISEEKSKQLAANVLNMAKMVFGYQKEMSADKAESKKLKAAAKDKAQDMLLGNPAVVASLKS